MLLQICSLIFGFVRNKQVKLFRSFRNGENGESQDNSEVQKRRQAFEESITSRSNSLATDTKTSNSDNSYFDPPIENYRFYYQGGGSTVNDHQTGFTIMRRKETESVGDRLLDEGTESYFGGYHPSKTRSGLYGSIASRDRDNREESPMSDDRESRRHKRQDSGGHSSNQTYSRKKKKNLSVFDEYE
mmetsp:Transcript_12932/g.17405  ORF Transcript_12932/g.17405 Transcript_12932/m.17405 type:complete len:187 (+) Transcript_12932:1132-1692(+)|eukprot:CAMPEP_0185582730 /NCGR_PEP_ID=MMETSP0434-20130131/21086_1 /TAXON_ID=626734 ORGANISM="Favella taraikaensis, Strain Fe Narragansett Bay" /NCGR_SAMPLE_ID=MMETSP0434 /ASSEMBLY_ACC=CAM_ASM_000379 /LENGTH=186 /DNA_ID=CAMNT_0028201635 /DNA_START=1194 /DNA_END=1754 /DNA_ORIENTATION=-